MSEKIMVVKPKQISYEGLFSVKELHQIIFQHWDQKGYEKFDIRHEVQEVGQGKEHEIWYSFNYDYTDEERFSIFMIMNFKTTEKVEITVDKEKKVLDKGSFFIHYKGSLVTDINNKWEKNGMYRLFKYLANQFIFTSHLASVKKRGQKDVEELYDKLMDYFNAHAFLR